MKIKKGELMVLWNLLESVKDKKINTQFSYFVAKNRLTIKDEIDSLQTAHAPTEDFKIYDQDRAKLAEAHADKIGDKPLVEGGQYIITEKIEEFNKQLDQLKNKFSSTIQHRQNQMDEFNKLLDEEYEFNGHAISLSNLPPDIEPIAMEILLKANLIQEG